MKGFEKRENQFNIKEKWKKQTLIIFALSAGIICVCFFVFNFVLFPIRYKNYVTEYSKKYDLDKALVYAIIKTESNFDKNAVSSSNARGLMQIIEPTGKWIASELEDEFLKDNLFIPEINIEYGCFYLNYLFEKFGDTDTVICAYNAGESAVRNWIGELGTIDPNKITYSETKNYLSKVKDYYNIYKSHIFFK